MTLEIKFSTATFRHLVYIQKQLATMTGIEPTTEEVLELLLERTASMIFTNEQAKKGGSIHRNHKEREGSTVRAYPIS